MSHNLFMYRLYRASLDFSDALALPDLNLLFS